MSNIKLGWINEFDTLVVNYVATFFMLDTFCSSSKLLKTFTGHTDSVYSIDYSTFDGKQLLCSASCDNTIRVWDVDTNKQVQILNEDLLAVSCVKFSQYYHYNYGRHIICSVCGEDIRFWDIKDNRQFQIFSKYEFQVCDIEFSPFNSGRYLCSGSHENTILLLDVETSKQLHVFNGHGAAITTKMKVIVLV
ncbi:WD-40 repeat-containing protein [Reticulomyxa filosa]|uniref:WD-40 repeat-containing protein n=1 Tax=Reticulomyxa filosa TaxID=46433 RepID=X6L7Y0_RETFI|nr:WD-40 repeat-containing protein [Reticulomyxa filosa]|eukprot:ETN97555.1 WD-40 repeat-containing protein [Reticulomyxa filosa]